MKQRMMMFTLIFILALCGTAYSRDYKIVMIAWAGWSPANVADVKGFWKEEGINVSLYNVENLQAVHTLFKSRRVDISFEMMGSIVSLYMDGLPVTIIAETDWSHGGDKIIVKKELDMNRLKGTPVGVYLNMPSVTFFLHRYLSATGLKLSDLRIIEMETDVLASHFIEGRFNMIVNYDPEAIRAEREGNGKVVATTATYEGCMPDGMMVLDDVLKTIPHSDLVKIFKGWIKAVKWIQDPANWKEYMDILNKHTFKGMPPFSEKDLKEIVDAARIHNATAQLERNQDGGGLHTYLKELKGFLSSNNMLKKDFDPEKIFDNKAVTEALKE